MPNNAWLQHVAEYRKSNPDVSYKNALKEAKASYKPAEKRPYNKKKVVVNDEPEVKTVEEYQEPDLPVISETSQLVNEERRERLNGDKAKSVLGIDQTKKKRTYIRKKKNQ